MRAVACPRPMPFQSTPSSRRVTKERERNQAPILGISIHALLTEGDTVKLRLLLLVVISIHALLTEGDNSI